MTYQLSSEKMAHRDKNNSVWDEITEYLWNNWKRCKKKQIRRNSRGKIGIGVQEIGEEGYDDKRAKGH